MKDGPLGDKYVVARKDGTDGPGGRHDGCDYFVLDLTHDPYARDALFTYAQSCRQELPQRAASIRAKLGELVSRPVRESRWTPIDAATGKPLDPATLLEPSTPTPNVRFEGEVDGG